MGTWRFFRYWEKRMTKRQDCALARCELGKFACVDRDRKASVGTTCEQAKIKDGKAIR